MVYIWYDMYLFTSDTIYNCYSVGWNLYCLFLEGVTHVILDKVRCIWYHILCYQVWVYGMCPCTACMVSYSMAMCRYPSDAYNILLSSVECLVSYNMV